MFHITWDKKTGGILLNSLVLPDTITVSPRPVFWEELDLIKLADFGFRYPHCQEPLMWACNKQYYYRGQFLFEVKGANLYDAPTVVLQPDVAGMQLCPVDIATMLQKNKDRMFLLESGALEFIRDTYDMYKTAKKSVEKVAFNKMDFEALALQEEKRTKTKMAIVKEDCDSFDVMPLETAEQQGKRVYQTTRIDKFIASFSGGKDSQVVLDLCTRAIPSTEFEVIYADTGYELPTSLELYKQVQEHYKQLYPDLKFSLTKNHETVLNYWDKIGTPSDTHRWCCTVMKTAPLYRSLKVEGTNQQAKVLAFEGVRREESSTRSSYNKIGKGVKHSLAINARPIIEWNTTEVFLYLFKYKLHINPAYRMGKARVGCLICPYSSAWDDMIVNRCFHKELSPFVERIVNWSKEGGIKDIDDYMKERKWKLRASGNYMNTESSVSFSKDNNKFTAVIKHSLHDFETWLPSICEYTITPSKKGYIGELKFDGTIYPFNIEYTSDNSYKFTLGGAVNIKLVSLLKRVLYKNTFCIQCEACEVECPVGALTIYPKIEINKSKCIHCHRCLLAHDKGCLVASSISVTTETIMKAKSGIDRYNTFGLKEEWLREYFVEKNNYWNSNNLGIKQVPAVKNWLKDAEIIDSKCEITPLGEYLSVLFQDMPDVVWEVLWINLSYNSFIVNWFVNNIDTDVPYSKNSIVEAIQEQYPNAYGNRTIENAASSLMSLLKNCPIGMSFNQFVPIDKQQAKRQEYSDLSEMAMAYSLYKYAEKKDVHSLRISDFYTGDYESGVYKEFCISKTHFASNLRILNSSKNRVLIAELNMGLDNISLREDMSAFDVLKSLLE